MHEVHKVEVIEKNGDHCRQWLWPLHSPEVAVCILGMRVPSTLALLTVREHECLELLAQGIETQPIASQMDVSASTVHTLLRRSKSSAFPT